MKIVEFKKSFSISINDNKVKIQPKHMYLFADTIWYSFKERLVEVIKETNRNMQSNHIQTIYNKIIKFEKNIDDVLNRLDFKKDKSTVFPILLRTGGIGDLIALSSVSINIVDLLNKNSKNLKFISQEKYKDVFKWFEKPISFISYFSPIVKYKSNNYLEKKRVNNKYKTIYYEGVIENSKDNWYELQYNTIGIDNFNTEWGRPRLKKERISNKESNIDLKKPSVLINPRSTAIIRSMRFQDIYESLIKCVENLDINIYVHKLNLRSQDLNFINNIKDTRIKIISAKSLSDFFLDAYDATLTISVDTALFHFREGIEKPGIGLYGPFPYECRTKYYKYTKSLNIKSKCPDMPCFIHVKQPDAICEYQQKLHDDKKYNIKYKDYAPCCCMEWNFTVNKQIVDNFKEYILNILS
jgi:ADP-heptose:LPS heptosyltransferase